MQPLCAAPLLHGESECPTRLTSIASPLWPTSPIEGTIAGEPHEIYPFLGSSHLEGPIDRHGMDAVFHGHAHHGVPEGKTQTGIPVYNVSQSVLATAFPDQPLFRVYTVDAARNSEARLVSR